MTKEDYIDALLELFDYAKKGRYIIPGGTGIDTYLEEKAGVLLELIHDRFDNFPLMFEGLKEGMWVWDNVLKKYIHILTIDFGVPSGGLIETENEYVPFEENRFYRKQVEE